MKLHQLIDLEAQLARDHAAEEDPAEWEAVLERDRAIAASLRLDADPVADAELFSGWLGALPEREQLPGQRVASAAGRLQGVLLLAGFLLGAGLVVGISRQLSASPVPHINVIVCWTATVGLQLMLALVLLLAGLLSAAGLSGPGRLLAGMQRAVLGLFRLIMDRVLRRHFPDHAGRLEAGLSRMSGKRPYYGQVFRWLGMQLSQWFAVAFNLGAVITLVFLGAVQQLPFGWSTTRADNAWLAGVVQAIAMPWAGLAPSAVPTERMIHASRIVNESHAFETAALETWLNFMVLSLLVYGVGLRLGLGWVSSINLRRALRNPPLDHEDFLRLRNRLTRSWFVDAAPGPSTGPVIVWGALPDGFEAAVIQRTGAQAVLRAGHAADPDVDTALCAQLAGSTARSLTLVMPVWNEPIRELKAFLHQLREAVGPSPTLVIDLVDGGSGEALSEVDPRTKMTWERFFNALNDPKLSVRTPGDEA